VLRSGMYGMPGGWSDHQLRDGGGAVRHALGAIQPTKVCLDSTRRNSEPNGDLLVRQAGADELHNRQLSAAPIRWLRTIVQAHFPSRERGAKVVGCLGSEAQTDATALANRVRRAAPTHTLSQLSRPARVSVSVMAQAVSARGRGTGFWACPRRGLTRWRFGSWPMPGGYGDVACLTSRAVQHFLKKP
jgi:hypothetical protein